MRIAVVGSINMDMAISVDRMPHKGETVLAGDVSFSCGGKGANQAVAMARVGAEVWMFGCVGDDGNGQAALDNLQQQGVHTEFVEIIPTVPTGNALIMLGEDDNMIVVVQGANLMADSVYATKICPKLENFELVVLQQEIPMEAVEQIIDWCYEKRIPVALNPAPAATISKNIIEKVTYLTPNEHEARIIFGNEKTVEELVLEYPEKLIITRGSQGAVAGKTSGEIIRVPALKTSVVDTTGAGDTFNGAFFVRAGKGDSLEDAIRFANIAAGLSTEQLGAQAGMPTEEQVNSLYNSMA